MPSSTRIKGKALTLSIASTDYECDISSVVMDNEEADDDVVTFCDAASGGSRQFFLEFTGIQSTDTASLWRYIWTNTGTDVAFTFRPHGNAVATESQPHFIGTVTVGPRPAMGGEAGPGSFTFDTRWDIVGVPTLDTGV